MQMSQTYGSGTVLHKYYRSTYVLITRNYAKLVSSKCANPVITKIVYILQLQPPIRTACTGGTSLFQDIITAILLYN